MDRLQTMAVFVAVAEEQGFAAAARRLSMSPPAVTRAVAAIEERIGTRLLHRTTRHVRLTEAGQRYLESTRRRRLPPACIASRGDNWPSPPRCCSAVYL